MSRTTKDQRETQEMLQRLTRVLVDHSSTAMPGHADSDAIALRRISMTLHSWHELECGMDNGAASYCITRGRKVNGTFEHDDDGDSYLEWHHHRGDRTTYDRVPDRERGALKRLAKIMARYPSLSFYIQGDPRGCALYILRPGDVPAGEKADSFYNRGIAVYR